jgi:uncharacterized peroxidase-related enzyme
VQHHGAGLRRLQQEEDFIQGLVTDWRTAATGDERLTAILAYAERLTLEPASVEESNIERMRKAGLSDEAILHTCEVTAYFNYVNRMADGLAVQLEDDWDQPLLRMPGETTGKTDD